MTYDIENKDFEVYDTPDLLGGDFALYKMCVAFPELVNERIRFFMGYGSEANLKWIYMLTEDYMYMHDCNNGVNLKSYYYRVPITFIECTGYATVGLYSYTYTVLKNGTIIPLRVIHEEEAAQTAIKTINTMIKSTMIRPRVIASEFDVTIEVLEEPYMEESELLEDPLKPYGYIRAKNEKYDLIEKYKKVTKKLKKRKLGTGFVDQFHEIDEDVDFFLLSSEINIIEQKWNDKFYEDISYIPYVSDIKIGISEVTGHMDTLFCDKKAVADRHNAQIIREGIDFISDRFIECERDGFSGDYCEKKMKEILRVSLELGELYGFCVNVSDFISKMLNAKGESADEIYEAYRKEMKATKLMEEQEAKEIKEVKPENDIASAESKKDTMTVTPIPTTDFRYTTQEDSKGDKLYNPQNIDEKNKPLIKKIIGIIWKTAMAILAIAMIILGGIGAIIGQGDYVTGGLVVASGVFFFGARKLFEGIKESLANFAIGIVCFVIAMIL